VFVPGATVKDAGFLSCSQYDRGDPDWKHPEGCEWFDSPEKPTDGSSSTGALELSSGATADPAGSALGGTNLLTFGLGALVLSGLVVGRRRTSARGR
jgi:hypothetical protein